MKLIMTLAVLCMTTALFAQERKAARLKKVDRMVSSFVQPPKQHDQVTGVVRMDDVCGLHIEIPSEKGTKNFFPVDLPEEFHVDGKRILFDGADVKADFNDGCHMVGAVSVSNVKAQRKSPHGR